MEATPNQTGLLVTPELRENLEEYVRKSKAAEAAHKAAETPKLSESIPKPTPTFRVSDVDYKTVEAQRLAREKADVIRRLLVAARIPDRHAGVSDFDGAEWLVARDRLMGRLGTGFIAGMLGNRGTGKTQMAAALIRETCQREASAIYVKAMDLFLDIRRAYQMEDECEADRIATYITPRLLVIDEFGVRGESPWEDRLVTHIIDKRYDAGRDTILISNQTPDEFKTAAGASITSRMSETGGIIECNWPSFRRKASQ